MQSLAILAVTLIVRSDHGYSAVLLLRRDWGECSIHLDIHVDVAIVHNSAFQKGKHCI